MTEVVPTRPDRDAPAFAARPIRYRITQHLLARVGNMLRRIVVRDRSAKGMLIEADDLKPGDHIKIELPSGCLVDGTVRWAKTGHAGIELSVVAQVKRPYAFEDVETVRARSSEAAQEPSVIVLTPERR